MAYDGAGVGPLAILAQEILRARLDGHQGTLEGGRRMREPHETHEMDGLLHDDDLAGQEWVFSQMPEQRALATTGATGQGDNAGLTLHGHLSNALGRGSSV